MVQIQCGPCQSGSQWVGVPSKRGLCQQRDPRERPQKREPCFTSQPCATDQPAGTWPGEVALPIPALRGPGVLCSPAPRHLSWGQQDQAWGVGPCQEPRPCRALNDRSYSQVPRMEAPTPASATPQEPWPGERAWAWAWGRVGNYQRRGGRAPPSCPGLSPLFCGVPGHPHGATFPGLGRPCHPQSHEPPTLGCGPCIC